MLDLHICALMLDINSGSLNIHLSINTSSLNMYVSLNIHASSTNISALTWDWNVHVDSSLVGNIDATGNTSHRLFDSMKLDSTIALLKSDVSTYITSYTNILLVVCVKITSNITLIICVKINIGTGSLCGDEVPLRSWCFGVANMALEDRNDLSFSMVRLNVLRSSTTPSQLSFSNICISVSHLLLCSSAAEVPCATDDCQYDSNDNNDDDMSFRICILLNRCSVFFTVRHN